jgi:hypothetical protein
MKWRLIADMVYLKSMNMNITPTREPRRLSRTATAIFTIFALFLAFAGGMFLMGVSSINREILPGAKMLILHCSGRSGKR